MRATACIVVLLALLNAAPVAAQEPNLSGRWSGYWQSETTGHTGPLKGRFRQIDDTKYRVVFTGRFFKVIPFRFAQTLNVVGSDGSSVMLSGSSRLPGFGTYEYDGSATGTDFSASYRSRKDRGVFILRR